MNKVFKGHNCICDAHDLKDFQLENLTYVNEKIEVVDKTKEGVLVSPIIETLQFKEIVGSWSCITSSDSTCELLVSVGVDGKMSKFFTYGEWGLGKENWYYNQDDEDAKMSVDEIILKDAINCFLKELDAQKRNLFIRRYWYLDTIQTIADRYGISQSSVKVELFRLRKQLKQFLQKEGFEL